MERGNGASENERALGEQKNRKMDENEVELSENGDREVFFSGVEKMHTSILSSSEIPRDNIVHVSVELEKTILDFCDKSSCQNDRGKLGGEKGTHEYGGTVEGESEKIPLLLSLGSILHPRTKT